MLPRRLFFVAALALAAPSPHASAQAAPQGEFSVQRFLPTPGPGNYLGTYGGRVYGHLVPSAGLTVDYAHDPFTIFTAECADAEQTNCEVTGVDTRLVRYQLTASLHATLSLIDRIELSLVLPLVLTSGESFAFTDGSTPVTLQGGTAFGVGDPRLGIRVNAFSSGPDGGLSIAFAAFATAPLGQLSAGSRYIGNDGPTAGGFGIVEFAESDFRLAANVGGMYRKATTLLSTEVRSVLMYRVAAAYDFTELLSLFAEVEGFSAFNGQVDENPLEGRLGLRLRQGDFAYTVAGGGGIIAGVDIPKFRLLGGFAWQPIRTDLDGDGILDSIDSCPNDPEDADGWFDEDGCPEPNNDGDHLDDASDPCPDQGEDMDGFEDEDGCPDPDNDGDRLIDGYDTCPNEPEDYDGDRDDDGCPDNDTDRDGIPDDIDRCPNEPEDTDGFGDTDGCPDIDYDGDGLADEEDDCPDEPETRNGIEDEDGCPEADSDNDGVVDLRDRCPNAPETLNGIRDSDGCPDGQEVLRQDGDRIVLLQQIQFASGSARIRRGQSRRILDALSTLLEQQAFIMLHIEGHTDNVGDPESNRQLSQERAEAVLEALASRGMARDKMTARGFGSEQSVADNETADGREANRRVAFQLER